MEQTSAQTDPALVLPSFAARALGCSITTVHNMIRRGDLPAQRMSGGWRVIARADLLALVERRKEGAHA